MVDGVIMRETAHAAVDALHATPNHATTEALKLQQARDAVSARILAIDSNPTLSSLEKANLKSDLLSVVGTSNADAILAAITKSLTDSRAVEADKNQESVGLALAVTSASLMTGSFNLHTSAGRFSFAAALAGPNQPKEVIEAIADDIERNPEMKAAAEKWNRMTPEQRQAHDAQKHANEQKTAELASELDEKPGVSAADKKTIRRLTAKPFAGRQETTEAVGQFLKDGNGAALRQTADQLEAELHHRQQSRIQYGLAHHDKNAVEYGNAAGLQDFDFIGMTNNAAMNEARRSVSEGFSKDNSVAAMRQGTNESRIEAYVSVYNETHKGQSVDQTELKEAATKFVSEHKASHHVFTRNELSEAQNEALAQGREAAHGDIKAAHANALKVAGNVRSVMESSGYSQVEAAASYTKIIVEDAAQNAKTLGVAVYEGAAGILEGKQADIDKAGHKVGQMGKKIVGVVLSEESAQKFGHTITVAAQTTGHFVSGAVQAGVAVGSSVISSVGTLSNAFSGMGNLFSGTAQAATPVDNHKAQIAAAKKLVDTDHDGKVSHLEMDNFLKAHGVTRKQADKDGKGIGADDVLALAAKKTSAIGHAASNDNTEAMLAAARKLEDTDHDGKISDKERAAARKEADKNHDGNISVAELGAYLKAHGVSVDQATNTSSQQLPNHKVALSKTAHGH